MIEDNSDCDMKNKFIKNNKAFTLIELIVVIAIIGIILILALPQVGKIQEANKNRKYEVYEMSIERGAKLYVDSRARDMFGNNNSGCVTVKYSELKASNVIKDFGMDDVTCSNDSETYVEVRKINDDYRYDVAIICRQGGETGKIVHKKTIDDSFTCSLNPDTAPPTVEVSPSSNSDWINPKELTVKIKISDESGLNKNIGIKYYWVNNAGEKVSKDFTYNYNNKKGVTKVSYKIPENNMKGVFGEVYLVVEPYRSTNTNGIQDVLGNEKSIAQQEGPYKLDGTKPSCGTATGAKDTWTNQNFTISQQCIDNESGCVKDTYEKNFTSSTTTYTFTIEDKAGNTNECKVDVYLDKDKPECGKIEGESTKWTNGNRTISAKCKDENAGECSKDKFEVTFTTDGKTDNIEISDKAGNTVSCEVDKYIDKTPPTCTSSGGSSTATTGPVTITGTCKDSLSGCTGNVSKKLTDDMNTSVSPGTVKDNAGNTTECPAEPVNINSTPNKPTIINPTNGNWVNYDFALTVKTTTASNLISHWQYSYDNSSWTTYDNSATNNFKTTNFTKERNQLVYIRVCNTNNVCSDSASTYIRIDKTKPTCGSASGSSTTWTNKDRYISQGCSDSASGCSASTFNKTFSTEGKTATIDISDKAGNSNSCNVNKYIDKTGPSCGTISGASTTWTNQDRTIKVGCSDSLSGCTSSQASNTFTTDAKTGSLSISDNAGNTKSCSVNVYIDKTPPEVDSFDYEFLSDHAICNNGYTSLDAQNLSFDVRVYNARAHDVSTNGVQSGIDHFEIVLAPTYYVVDNSNTAHAIYCGEAGCLESPNRFKRVNVTNVQTTSDGYYTFPSTKASASISNSYFGNTQKFCADWCINIRAHDKAGNSKQMIHSWGTGSTCQKHYNNAQGY